jgi:hypothetical protein
MELVATASCTECRAQKQITVKSGRVAVEELKRAGWSVRLGKDRDRCPECQKPIVTPTRSETKPSDYAWSAVQIHPVLRAGGFAHEPGAAIWREGPDFCWEESMPREEWVDGAELCVRVHYALGRAKRTGDYGRPTTAQDAHNLAEGLRLLTSYLAEQGFAAKVDARGNERDHLIVYRLAEATDPVVVPLVQPA